VCPLTSSWVLSGRGVGLTGSRYGDSSISTLRSSWPYHVFRKLPVIIFISIFHRFTHVYTRLANPDPRSCVFYPLDPKYIFFGSRIRIRHELPVSKLDYKNLHLKT
jgi:hypothetical protein